MESKVFDYLDYYARLCPSERKYTLAGNSYFEIYIFTKEPLDIVKELDSLDSLSVEHELKKGYDKFCAWIDAEDAIMGKIEAGILQISKKWNWK